LTDQRPTTKGLWPWLLILLTVVGLVALGVSMVMRGRGAVDDLNAQLALLQRADDSSETLHEWAGEDAHAIAGSLRGFTLPADTADLVLARQGQTRPTFWLRIVLPATSLGDLLMSTCLPALEAGNVPDFAYGTQPGIIANLPWWQPDTLSAPAGAACEDASGVHFALAAGIEGELATIYLEIASG
jgi:hypothetical protein